MERRYIVMRQNGSYDDHVKYPVFCCEYQQDMVDYIVMKNEQVVRITLLAIELYNGSNEPYQWSRHDSICKLGTHYFIEVPYLPRK